MYSLFSQPPVATSSRSFEHYPDIFESESEFRIDIAAPGIHKDDFDITATDNTLTIKAESEFSVPEGFRHRRQGLARTTNLEKVFRFRQPISTSDISAEVNSGIITLTVPKKTGDVVKITAQ